MKIHWITFAPIEKGEDGYTSQLASARYRILIPARKLADKGVNIQVFNTQTITKDVPMDILQCEQLVFSKSFTPVNEFIAREAKARGVRILVDLCDNHFASEPELATHLKSMCSLADTIICSTAAMAQALMENTGRVGTVVEDPFEGTRLEARYKPGPSMRLCWFGHPINVSSMLRQMDNLNTLAKGGSLGPEPELTLVTGVIPELTQAVDRYNATAPALRLNLYPWSLTQTFDTIKASDAVLITTEGNAAFRAVKSPNRVIEPLIAGRMVIANPLPAYEPFADCAILNEDLASGLKTLTGLNQGDVVKRIEAAQTRIEAKHSPEVIAQQWYSVFSAATKNRPGEGQPMRLNLGCGDKILPGYINVDVAAARAGKQPDVICDLRNLQSFESNSVDEILSVHVVEHFWRWEVVDILKEWVRVLKPGGKMILECPNLLSACEEVLKNPDLASGPGQEGQRSMWVLYGDPSWKDPLMIHRWAYTPRSLATVMFEAGLTDLMQEPAQFKLREPRDMRITGIKPAGSLV